VAANNQLSVYLPNDLAHRVEVAKETGFDPKTFMKDALARALAGEQDPAEDGHGAAYQQVLSALGYAPDDNPDVEQVLHTIAAVREAAEAPSRVPEADPTLSEETAQQLTDAAFTRGEITSYEVAYVEGIDQVQAKLDLVSSTGGWPISVSPSPHQQDQFLLVSAWPEQ
jgi:hypothetical protein